MEHKDNNTTDADSIVPETEQRSVTLSAMSTPETLMLTVDDDADDDEQEACLAALLLAALKISEDHLLQNKGYQRIRKLQDTAQGSLLLGKVTVSSVGNNIEAGARVVIKKADRPLTNKFLIRDDDLFHYVTDKSVLNEAYVLQMILVRSLNHADRVKHMQHLVDVFESDTEYYMLTRYVDNSVSLREFIIHSHALMKQGKVSAHCYHTAIRRIMLQLLQTIEYLHTVLQCCHLDICTSNIRVQHSEYIVEDDDDSKECDAKLTLNPHLSIIVCDFAASAFFTRLNALNQVSFQCDRYHINKSNEAYLLPDLYEGRVYDARAADVWSVGMLLCECILGGPLFAANNRAAFMTAIASNSVDRYLSKRDASATLFSLECLTLCAALLNINRPLAQYVDVSSLMLHSWFH